MSDDNNGVTEDEELEESEELEDPEGSEETEESEKTEKSEETEESGEAEEASDSEPSEGGADDSDDSDNSDDGPKPVTDEAAKEAIEELPHELDEDEARAAAIEEQSEDYDFEGDAHHEEEPEPDDDHRDVDSDVVGVAAFFDHPDHLMYAASQARDASYRDFDAYSPFPIHGMDEAMGLPRSWIPWVTFFAGLTGLSTAATIEFGIMGFDWPMIFGGKPFIAWPSFVPVMFELTVLFAGVTTAIVMLAAAGCFRKPFIISPEITNDRFVLWISANDEKFDGEDVVEFMRALNPMEIRTIRKDGEE